MSNSELMNVKNLIDDSFLDKPALFLRSTGSNISLTVGAYPVVDPYYDLVPILWNSTDYQRGDVIDVEDKIINNVDETQQFITVSETGQYKITYNIHLEKANTFFTDIYSYINYLSPTAVLSPITVPPSTRYYVPSSKSCGYYRFETDSTQTMLQYTTVETLEAGSGIQLKVLPYKTPTPTPAVTVLISAGAGNYPTSPVPTQVKAEIFISKL
jgi:hypothetical protein